MRYIRKDRQDKNKIKNQMVEEKKKYYKKVYIEKTNKTMRFQLKLKFSFKISVYPSIKSTPTTNCYSIFI
jgi:hypothetical protein